MQILLQRLWRGIDVFMAVVMTLMIVLVFTNVVLRYGFSSGLRASVELSRLGLVWIVMLGAAIVLRRGEHLAVYEFSEKFFPDAVPYLKKLCWFIVFIAVGMLFIGSFRQMMANWTDISPITGLPSAFFYLSGVVSGALMAVIALMRIFVPDWQYDEAQEEQKS